MDRLDAMRVLVTAVDAGSLSAAGRRLRTPLATVSRKVADLEAHLGTRLLNRSSRALTLTEAGRAYVDACRRILDDVGEAERAAKGEYRAAKGELVVTAPVVFGRLHVVPVVAQFLGAYPDIDIRLQLADRVVSLHEERVDVAVRIGALPDSSLIATAVGETRRVVCASPAYFAAHGRPVRPADLAAHDCITFDGLGAPDAWTLVVRKRVETVRLHSRLLVNAADAAIDAAIAGLGITRALSYQVADALAAGALALALEAYEPPPWPVSVVHAGPRAVPQKLRAFVDFAVPRLRARLGDGARASRPLQ